MGWIGVKTKAMDPEENSKAIKSYPYSCSKCLPFTDACHMCSLYPNSVQSTEHFPEPYSTYCSALPIK